MTHKSSSLSSAERVDQALQNWDQLGHYEKKLFEIRTSKGKQLGQYQVKQKGLRREKVEKINWATMKKHFTISISKEKQLGHYDQTVYNKNK